MMRLIAALAAGLLFGFGLALSNMVDPNRVLGFLDFFGHWDATLIFVMGGALGVTLIGYRFVLRQKQPLFDLSFHLPTKKQIDRPLLLGAALFGLGWGMSGYCPGPALTTLSLGSFEPLLFVPAMIIGAQLARLLEK